MKHRLTRFRRLGVSAAAVALSLTGLSVLGLSTAAFAAAGLAPGSAITAASVPGINATGIDQPAGNLTLTFAAGTTWATGDTVLITVKDASGGATVTFDHNPSLGTTPTPPVGDNSLCLSVTACTITGAGTNTETLTLTGTPGQANVPQPETIVLTNIGYTTAASAPGLVTISDTVTGTLNNPAGVTFATGVAASNAAVGKPLVSVFADSTPNVGTGTTTSGGPWEVQLSGANTSWNTGDKIYVDIARNDGTNCETAGFPDTVGFASAPTAIVQVTQNGTTTTTPTVTTSVGIAPGSSCGTFSGVNNQLVITFTNSGTLGFGQYPSGAAIDIILIGSGATSGPSLTASADFYKYAASTASCYAAVGATDCYTAAPASLIQSGTNLGPIDVAYGTTPNAQPLFGNSNRNTALACTAAGICSATPAGTPAGIANDDLMAGTLANGVAGGSNLGATTNGSALTGAAIVNWGGALTAVITTGTTVTSVATACAHATLAGDSIIVGSSPGVDYFVASAPCAGGAQPVVAQVAQFSEAVGANVSDATTPATCTIQMPVPNTIPAGTRLRVGIPVVPALANATTTTLVVAATAGPGAAVTVSVFCWAPTTGNPFGAGVPVGGPSDANITFGLVTVTANSPATTLQYNFATCFNSLCGESVNNAISPIVLHEATAGSLGGGTTGYFCVTLNQPIAGIVEWNNSASPTATATGGGIAVSPTLTLFTPGGQAGPTVLEGQVTTASSGTPGTVTLSGLSINVPQAPLAVTANIVTGASNASCTLGNAVPSTSNPVTLAFVAGRTFGQSDADTAAQEVENLGCSTGHDTPGTVTPQVAVAAVGDLTFNDAEAASYLDGILPRPGAAYGVVTTGPSVPARLGGTGTLVARPSDPLGGLTAMLSALRIIGATDVYVLGGVLAFPQAFITQLQSTPVFNCDGSQHLNPTNGTTQFLTVHVIAGADGTADGTAEMAGTFFGPVGVGTAEIPGAYAGGFNDTTGSNGSGTASAPDTPVATCVVVNDSEFQDATAIGAAASNGAFGGDMGAPGSALAAEGGSIPVFETGPTALSIDAQTGLINDACRQVIDLGGPLALTDAVGAAEAALGMSWVRVGGIDYTDTSVQTANFELSSLNASGQPTGLDFDPAPGPLAAGPGQSFAIVVRGDYYTDGFTAAGISDNSIFLPAGSIPILETWDSNNTHSPGGTNYLGNFLQNIGQKSYDTFTPDVNSGGLATINNLWFIGGTFAISQSLENTVINDLNVSGTPS